jgi:hypothetical protein
MEQAAEECSLIFDRLTDEDRQHLMVRLLAVGALHAGDIDFIVETANLAQEAVLEFVQ